MSASERLARPQAPCYFCGADPAPALFTTPVCVACAKVSRVVFATERERMGATLCHADGRRYWFSWSEGDTPHLRDFYATEVERRGARLALIAAGRATETDPEFLANVNNYIEQVGWSPAIERALSHQQQSVAETDGALAEAERILGLRP